MGVSPFPTPFMTSASSPAICYGGESPNHLSFFTPCAKTPPLAMVVSPGLPRPESTKQSRPSVRRSISGQLEASATDSCSNKGHISIALPTLSAGETSSATKPPPPPEDPAAEKEAMLLRQDAYQCANILVAFLSAMSAMSLGFASKEYHLLCWLCIVLGASVGLFLVLLLFFTIFRYWKLREEISKERNLLGVSTRILRHWCVGVAILGVAATYVFAIVCLVVVSAVRVHRKVEEN